MTQYKQDIWMKLLRAGIVQGTAPRADKLESPWYVKLLLAVSGWIASLFLIGVLAMVSISIVFESSVALFIGLIMLAVTFAILRSPKNEFIEHLALSISLAGQALVVYGIFDNLGETESGSWLCVVVLQAILVAAMPNFIHRVFSAFIAGLAFVMVLFFSGLFFAASGSLMFGVAWCWQNEFSNLKQMRTLQAIGYGLALALVFIKAMEFSGYKWIGWIGYSGTETLGSPWMGELLAGAAILYVVWDILQRYRQSFSQPLTTLPLLGTAVVCGLSLEVPGLTVGILLVVLGFAGTNLLLLGLGITSLISFISFYYYLLDVTLIVKSGSLCVTGISLLVLRWCMLRVLSAKKEGKHV
jgi:uncharacterized membrane protein